MTSRERLLTTLAGKIPDCVQVCPDFSNMLSARLTGKLALKGNLHTTEVMLRGTVETVIAASKKAIDDAAEGGRFILATGDQCGRDTPDANIRAMVETARTYGRYR